MKDERCHPNSQSYSGTTGDTPVAPRVSSHCSLLTAHCSLLTAHCSLPTAHCPPPPCPTSTTAPVPNFYHRPLTWLFWLAALSLDAVALSINYEGPFASALGLGQLFVVSGWLVLGKSHPLARASWFVAVLIVLVAPDYLVPRWRSSMHQDVVWPHVLALMTTAGAFTALATAVWSAFLWNVSTPEPQPPRKPQYSIAVLLGWMTVLALSTTCVRLADFSLLNETPRDLVSGSGLAGAVAIFIAASIGPHRESWLARVLSAIGFIACIGVMAAAGVPPEAAAVAVGALAFVVLWTIVVRIDCHRAKVTAAELATTPPDATSTLAHQLRVFTNEA
jgi:hypothetical protein